MPTSQKPRRKYCPQTNVHKTYVEGMVRVGPDGLLKFERDSEGRLFSPQTLTGTLSVCTSYVRASGKKKFSFAHNLQGNVAFPNENKQLLNDFSVLAAIDTNTVFIDDIRVSATCLMTSGGHLQSQKGAMEFSVDRFVLFDVPSDINPEMAAIDIALRHFLKSSTEKVGLITDSELGKHKEINQRFLPFLSDKLLRKNVQLVYASADTGDSFSNRLIKQCDKLAGEIVEHCKKYGAEFSPYEDRNSYCRGWVTFTDARDE